MPSSAMAINSSHGQNEFDESPIKEDGEKYPRFMEGKYNMKKKEKWILARNKTSTLRISPSHTNGTYAVGVVHGSPDCFTLRLTQLQHKNPKGIHPKKKDFTRG